MIGVPQWLILWPLSFNTLYAICFTFLRTLTLQIMRTTLDHIVRVKVPNLLSITTIDDSSIELEDEQVLLGITIDSNFFFENHINSICKKASQMFNGIEKITPYLKTKK